ncbi:MAG: MoaD/ThiS family protein [SAR202 cluster bacterium]|nr:MoaD/ThiS family protein [SAR202 cluster bacterium]
MELNVRLFALYRERAGANTISVAVNDGATVADLTAEVRRQLPNLAPPEVNIVVAVNADYAAPDVILKPGDDVCLIPPVSGG